MVVLSPGTIYQEYDTVSAKEWLANILGACGRNEMRASYSWVQVPTSCPYIGSIMSDQEFDKLIDKILALDCTMHLHEPIQKMTDLVKYP